MDKRAYCDHMKIRELKPYCELDKDYKISSTTLACNFFKLNEVRANTLKAFGL